MARIKQQSVEEVKVAADIVAVVSARTQLRRSGARWTGRCPFHEERTPSFSVNAQDKLFYCFGCGKGGDLVSFVRETENVDFSGAIEWLADRFGVRLEYEETSPQLEAQRGRTKRLHELLDQAASFYERYLWESQAGSRARDYLTGRGLREEVCREFRLGLALGGTTLARKAVEKGFTRAELAAAGLVNRRGHDYFARRLMFPLADARGRVVGFQARKLREDDPLKAKYVNSPEGELFRKGDLLYGLHRARNAIAKADRACVVEGNTDVLALRQAGFDPVVASMGTALTERQLKELGRLTHKLYLCFDGDAAGEAATLRGWSSRRRRASSCTSSRSRPASTRPTSRTASRSAAHRGGLPRVPGAARARARARPAGGVRPRARGAGAVRGLARAAGGDAARRRPARPAEGDAGRPRAPRSRGDRDGLAQAARRWGAARARCARGLRRAPRLLRILAELGPDHFDVVLHRRLCEHLLERGSADAELVALLAELDARAASEGIDEETGEQLLLRLRERRLRRELAVADEERLPDLQQALAKIRTAFREFA